MQLRTDEVGMKHDGGSVTVCPAEKDYHFARYTRFEFSVHFNPTDIVQLDRIINIDR
jgi:hypothetical protein